MSHRRAAYKTQSLPTLLREMRKALLEGNAVTYSSALTACGRSSHWRLALELPRATAWCENALLAACAAGGAWQMALEVYESMLRADTADASSLASLLRACSVASLWQQACWYLFAPGIPSEWPHLITAAEACGLASAWQRAMLHGMKSLSLGTWCTVMESAWNHQLSSF